MPLITRQRRQELNSKIVNSTTQNLMDSVTLGIVADTNDPQQMGRIRVVCHRWGDSFDAPIEHIPWAMYATPFGGQVQVGTRGPGIDAVDGGVAYGMWAIPVVGAQVLVMCIDSDPNQRVYIGSVYDQFTTNTMPHGRYMYDDHPNLDNTLTPSGPYSSTEKPIEPLSTNLRQAFGNKTNPNYEWRNRGADYQAAALDVANLSATRSSVVDDKDVSYEGWKSTQGYQTDRQDPAAPTTATSRNLSPMVYSFTSPGFHALSMDDRIENCRVRLRTTAGHQILMDDTNERIYIATARGENWIELDQNGNIDVYTNNKVNISAKKGINLTTDEDIRMYASKSIHMFASEEIRMQAGKDIAIKTAENLRIETGVSFYVTAVDQINAKSGSNMNMSSGMNINHMASADIVQTATNIHHNGPAADVATDASPEKAKWTHRVPQHEPYARGMTKNDYTHEPELAYDDPNVNKVERGAMTTRGLYWRR